MPKQRPSLLSVQATWVEFKPPANAVDAESWKLSKLEYPVSPLEVVYNGSQSMHVVDEQGVSVHAQQSEHHLQIRYGSSCYQIP